MKNSTYTPTVISTNPTVVNTTKTRLNGYIPIASRCRTYNGAPTNGTTELQGMSVINHRTCSGGACQIRLVFGLWANGLSAIAQTEADTGGTILGIPVASSVSIKASVEYNGVRYPVYFNGQRAKTIDAYGIALSDPIGITIPGNTLFKTHTYVAAASGRIPRHQFLNGTFNDGMEWGTTITDKTLTGTTTTAPLNTGTGYGFTPLAILGIPLDKNFGAVAGVGDSVIWGLRDSQALETYGWFDGLFSGIRGTMMLAVSGGQGQQFADPTRSWRRFALLQQAGINACVLNYGGNDLKNGQSVAQTQTSFTDVATRLDAIGIRVFAATLCPYNTSSDNWATLGNQISDPGESLRVQYNDWLRSKPGVVQGVLDISTSVETSVNSGLWKVDGTPQKYTLDGVHPSPYGYANIISDQIANRTLFDLIA